MCACSQGYLWSINSDVKPITFFSWHLPDNHTAATWVLSGLISPTRLRNSCSLLYALGLPLFLKCVCLLCAFDGPTQPPALFVFSGALLFITSLVSPSPHAKYKQKENNKLLPLAQAAAFPIHSLRRKVSFKGRRASTHRPLLGMSETHFLHQESCSEGSWWQLWRQCHFLPFTGYANRNCTSYKSSMQ